MKITAVPAGFLQPLLASITTLITDVLSPSAYGDARRQKKTVVFLQKVAARCLFQGAQRASTFFPLEMQILSISNESY